MKKVQLTPQQWLIEATKSKSVDLGDTMSRLLNQLDENSIPYRINEHIFNELCEQQTTAVKDVSCIPLELIIWPGDQDKTTVIIPWLPIEALGQTEEMNGVKMATKAYQWLINQYISYSFSEDEEDDEIIDRLSLLSDDQKKEHFSMMENAIRNAPIDQMRRDRCLKRIIRLQEFFARPESERKEYLSKFDVKVDFDNISSEERNVILLEFDQLIRPIIGKNGFPDWTHPEFIDKILHQ